MKQKIFLGPAGIPTVSKASSSTGGIKTVAEIGLNAMEIEFVRGVRMDLKMAEECGKVARESGVRLSVHAPYYINLLSEKEKIVKESEKRILDSVERTSLMGADIVVVHAGYYGKFTKDKAFEKILEEAKSLIDKMKSNGWDNTLLGFETTGRVKSFGNIEEIVEICRKVKGCGIVLDAAHIFARQAGKINYSEVFDKIEPLNLEHVHMHFSGIKWRLADGGGNEWHHLPISVAQPPFEPLAKEILRRRLNITIICESPLLEQDSLVMKSAFERIGHKLK